MSIFSPPAGNVCPDLPRFPPGTVLPIHTNDATGTAILGGAINPLRQGEHSVIGCYF
jgi:hypothetical protein